MNIVNVRSRKADSRISDAVSIHMHCTQALIENLERQLSGVTDLLMAMAPERIERALAEQLMRVRSNSSR